MGEARYTGDMGTPAYVDYVWAQRQLMETPVNLYRVAHYLIRRERCVLNHSDIYEGR